MYEYNSHLETEVLGQILEIVVAMMESKQRELLKGVLAFIKVSNMWLGSCNYLLFIFKA